MVAVRAEHQERAVDQEEQPDQEEEQPEEAESHRTRPQGPLGLNDAGRMVLTEEEREWALSIKEAIEQEGTSNLEALPNDYWYAQIALVDKADIASAMDRASRMQMFRQEYDILDTVAQGQKVIAGFMELWPEFYLSLGYNREEGNYSLVFDLARFHTSVLKENPAAYRIWFQAIYYLNHCCCSDLEAVRRGLILIFECQGFEWKKNFGLEVARPYWSDIAGVYPLQHHQIRYFHTGMFLNTLVSMAKKFMPVAARDQFKVGCVCEQGRLSDLYLTPSAKDANARFMARLTACLTMRYANEASFKL